MTNNVKNVNDPQPDEPVPSTTAATAETPTMHVLEHMGLQSPTKIYKSLQGSIWRAQRPFNLHLRIDIASVSHINHDDDDDAAAPGNDPEQKTPSSAPFCKQPSPTSPVTPMTPATPSTPVVIKVANRKLHSQHLAKVGNRYYRVHENILLESDILRFLTQTQACPASIIKFDDFFTLHHKYLLLMEDGGSSLFAFVQSAHELITAGVLSTAHWKCMVQRVFAQMLESIEFIHARRVCHFDVSLENYLINDVNVEVTSPTPTGKEHVEFVLSDVQIKLCDFGLAEHFRTNDFSTRKYCGKQNYKSPECLQKRDAFDAQKNDIFCLGVSLFMMLIGAHPWNMADETDALYAYMTSGLMKDVLVQWNKSALMDDQFVDLEQRMFAPQAQRISLADIRKHAWLNPKNDDAGQFK